MANDKKISELVGVTTVDSSALITVVQGGENFKISQSDYIAGLGVTGTIEQTGSVTGVPILDPQGSQNLIRNVEPGSGIAASVSPENGLAIKHNFQTGDAGGAQVLANPTSASPIIRSIKGVGEIQVTSSGDVIQISTGGVPVASSTIVVNQLSDFPTPVGDLITLADDTTYLISSSINLGANRFQMGDNTAVTGVSPFTASLASTTTGVLFTGKDGANADISNISVTAIDATLFDFDYVTPDTGTIAINRVIATTVKVIGQFVNVRTLLLGENRIAASDNGISFGGVFRTVSLTSTGITQSAGIVLDLGSAVFDTFSVETLIVRSLDPSVVVLSGLTDSGNISADGSGVIRNVSVEGERSPSVGLLLTDLRWLLATNFSLPPTVNEALLTMRNNAAATTIVADTPTKFAGNTFTGSQLSRFTTTTDGRMTYIGLTPVSSRVVASMSVSKVANNADDYRVYLAKNGTAITESGIRFTIVDGGQYVAVHINQIVDLVTDDYLELFVEGVGNANAPRLVDCSFVSAANA